MCSYASFSGCEYRIRLTRRRSRIVAAPPDMLIEIVTALEY